MSLTMAYRLKTVEPVGLGFRRIVCEQIDRALAEVSDRRIERPQVIHQVRKRCKKIRAALRLVQGGLGDAYARENAWYRDAGREISGARDVEAMIETSDALAQRLAGREEALVIQRVCLQLRERRDAFMADDERIEALLHAFESSMVVGRKRVASLSVKGHGHDVVISGLRKTYARARAAMHAADSDPKAGNVHAWRKLAAYHWRHMQLLHPCWPVMVHARCGEAKRLSEALGDLHSLHVLNVWSRGESSRFRDDVDIEAFLRLAEHRAVRIGRRSQRLGGRLFAEKPGHLGRRFGIYFEVASKKF